MSLLFQSNVLFYDTMDYRSSVSHLTLAWLSRILVWGPDHKVLRMHISEQALIGNWKTHGNIYLVWSSCDEFENRVRHPT